MADGDRFCGLVKLEIEMQLGTPGRLRVLRNMGPSNERNALDFLSVFCKICVRTLSYGFRNSAIKILQWVSKLKENFY